MTRLLALLLCLGVWLFATASPCAEPPPAYTLEVDSDAVDVVSFSSLLVPLAQELGADVARPGATAPARAAVRIVYRHASHTLEVHAQRRDAAEAVRSVRTNDATAARDAVLLAGNLARDEAHELLEALRKPATLAPPTPQPSSAPPLATRAIVTRPRSAPARTPKLVLPTLAQESPDHGYLPANVGLAWPLAVNMRRPYASSAFDLSLFFGRMGRIGGVQAGTGVVVAHRASRGAQVGVFASIALGGWSGVQLGAGTTYVRGPVQGAQIAAGFTSASHLVGAQIALFNVAENVEGAQVGLVNVARHARGVQLGLVNVAEESDAAVGLVSLSRHSMHPIAWVSNLAYLNAGVRFDSKYLYTLTAIGIGSNEIPLSRGGLGTVAGLGTTLRLPSHLELDVQQLLSWMVEPGRTPSLSNLTLHTHAQLGWRFARHLRVFAGGGVRWPAQVQIGRDVIRPEVLAGVSF